MEDTEIGYREPVGQKSMDDMLQLGAEEEKRRSYRRIQRRIEMANELFLIEVLAGFFLVGLVSTMLGTLLRNLFGIRYLLPTYQMIGAVILVIWMRGKKISLGECCRIKKPEPLLLFLALLAGPACYAASFGIASFIQILFPNHGGRGTTPLTASLASALVNAMAAGVFEEILFRGVLLHAYRKKSLKYGILLSSLLFGMLHFNIQQCSYAVFVGIFLCLVYEVTGNLLYAVVTHFFIDMQPILWITAMGKFEKFSNLLLAEGSPVMTAVRWLPPTLLSVLLLLVVLWLMKRQVQEKALMNETKFAADQEREEQIAELRFWDANLVAGTIICGFVICFDMLSSFVSRY